MGPSRYAFALALSEALLAMTEIARSSAQTAAIAKAVAEGLASR